MRMDDLKSKNAHIPHRPITPHRKFAGKTRFGPYGDFLLELDTYVGDVMQALKKTGQLDKWMNHPIVPT